MDATVVIPARNEARSIGPLLESLLGQTRRPRRILVVDAGSTDATKAVVEAIAAKTGGLVHLVEAGPAFPGRARNIGIKRADSDVVVLLDAGVKIGPDWLQRLLAPMEGDESVQIVYGNYEPVVETAFDRAVAIMWVDPSPALKARIRAESVACLALRKRVWRSVGGFPEDLRAAEDTLFKDTLRTAGFQSRQAPDAIIFWELPRSLGGVFRKLRDYSRYALQAGLFRRWHRAVLRMYVVVFAAAAVLHLAFGSAFAATALLATFYLVRAAANSRRKWEFVGTWRNVPLAMVAVAVIVLVSDAAMLTGVVQWLLSGLPKTGWAAAQPSEG